MLFLFLLSFPKVHHTQLLLAKKHLRTLIAERSVAVVGFASSVVAALLIVAGGDKFAVLRESTDENLWDGCCIELIVGVAADVAFAYRNQIHYFGMAAAPNQPPPLRPLWIHNLADDERLLPLAAA